MANPEPLNLEDLWDWFEKKFGKDAMNRYYGYETNELINEIKRRIKSACEFYLKYKDRPKRLIRDYPEPKINFSDILTEIGFIAKYILDGQQTRSMLDFSLPILQSGDVMGMYYDNIGLVELVNNKYQYNSFDGATNSSFCPGFNWDLGFEEVECLEDLYEGPAKCKNCSAHISRMSAFSHEGYYYCEKCFGEHFTPCAFCGAVVKNEDAFISSIDGPLCERCFSSTYRFCERCGNLVLLENIEDEEEVFCDECVRQYNQFNIPISPFSKTVEDMRRAA